MNIKSSHKGQTVKTAYVEGTADLNEAVAFVIDHFNESERRLADWDADRMSDGTVVVRLYTA